MIRKQISAILICLLLVAFTAPFIQAQTDDASAKIKAKIAKYGSGKKKRVKVKTRDGRELKGYISRTDADAFDLTDSKNGQISTLAYRDVSSVNNISGLSIGTIATIAGLAAGGIIITSLLLVRCRNEGGCGGY